MNKNYSDILEDYIKNFELKNNIKLKKPKQKGTSAKSKSKYANPIQKIEISVDNLSTRIREYKNEMSLLNFNDFKDFNPKKKSDFIVESSPIIEEEVKAETVDDPYVKSLVRFQELNRQFSGSNGLKPCDMKYLLQKPLTREQIFQHDKDLLNKINLEKTKPENSECIENFLKECLRITEQVPILKKPSTQTDLLKL